GIGFMGVSTAAHSRNRAPLMGLLGAIVKMGGDPIMNVDRFLAHDLLKLRFLRCENCPPENGGSGQTGGADEQWQPARGGNLAGWERFQVKLHFAAVFRPAAAGQR